MSVLSFLKGAKVTEVTPEKGKSGGPRKQRNPNPTLVAIRVFKDGSVFPSQAAVDMFSLEYRDAVITWEDVPAQPAVMGTDGKIKKEAKEAHKRRKSSVDGEVGNGFDVIDSRTWANYKGEGNLIFISPVSKNAGKVDLFASTVYDDNGKGSSVMDQGAATFGSEILVPAIKDIYGIELNDEKPYVDMVILKEITVEGEKIDFNEKFSQPVMFFPKRIMRGADKGKSDYVRREKVPVYGFLPLELAGISDAAATTLEEKTPERGVTTAALEATEA
jgi:hypothetical protein